MKLYEIPGSSKIRLVGETTVYLFDHIDGMYSICYNNEGQVVHLVAWAEVEIVNDEGEINAR